MKTKAIPFSWIERWGKRLDCGPYMSGVIETRERLEALGPKTRPLCELTKGGMAGMYHVGMDKLKWVDGPEHGVRFLTSSNILKADFSSQPFISRKQVTGNPLFQCPAGSTLITRSGRIGRMAYCRDEMAKMAISQDVLKIVPDADKILPGYLFAFLSTKYGIPMVVGGTFGSIIVHIEAENIADLPVPRLGDFIENKSHALVEKAARSRSKAADLFEIAQRHVETLLGDWRTLNPRGGKCWTSVPASTLSARCDAYYFSERCLAARRAFDFVEGCRSRSLGSVAEVFIPGMFKRQYADDPAYGYPYVTGADVFQIAATSNQYLLRRVVEDYGLLVKKGMILIQEAGQLGGLIGRSVPVGRYLDGFAVSNNMVRVITGDDDIGYLFAVLCSEPGVILISREAAGSSIPHIDASRIKRIEIPWAEPEVRKRIGRFVIEARDLRDDACDCEAQARAIVERAIEEAA